MSGSTSPVTARPVLRQVLGLRRTFWAASAMELIERWGYFNMRLALGACLTLGVLDGGYGFDAGQRGIILTSLTALVACLPVVMGGLVDRVGFKRSLLLALALELLGSLVLASQAGFGAVLAGCLAVGVGVGVFKPAVQGLVAHNLGEASGALGWGLFYAVVNVAGILAQVLVGSSSNLALVFGLNAALAALNLLPLWLLVEPAPPPGAPARPLLPTWQEVGAILSATWRDLCSPALALLIVAISLFHLAHAQCLAWLPTHLVDWGTMRWEARAYYGVPDYYADWLVKANMGLVVVLTLPVAIVAGWLTPIRAMQLGTIVLGVGVVVAGSTQLFSVAALGLLVVTLGEVLVGPRLKDHLARLAPPGQEARYMGYSDVPQGLAWLVGLLVGDALYARLGDFRSLAREWLVEVGGQQRVVVEALQDWEVGTALALQMHVPTREALDQLWQLAHPQQAWWLLAALTVPAVLGLWAHARRLEPTGAAGRGEEAA
ncbi:MAG: MFS transporter [Candidatus Sericytochromatia bacterium]|nr:MFS transporter [Candidatus Sericytochromatia bacterium]